MLNYTILFVYWPVIHADFMVKYEDSPVTIVHMYLVHIFPTISLLIVYCTTERILIKASHSKVVVPLMIVYSYLNYAEVKRRGEPIYWFLTWEDWTSPAIALVVGLLLIGLWGGTAKLTEIGKGVVVRD